jgi:hypothetical protein
MLSLRLRLVNWRYVLEGLPEFLQLVVRVARFEHFVWLPATMLIHNPYYV